MIHRGQLTITFAEGLNIRREPRIPDPWGNYENPDDRKPNHIDKDQIETINGKPFAEEMEFTDIPLVRGQAVDGNLQGFWWAQVEIKTKNGEETFAYISKSRKTEDFVKGRGKDELPRRDQQGNIVEPNMGRASTVLKAGFPTPGGAQTPSR
jgi:hypothetical protein